MLDPVATIGIPEGWQIESQTFDYGDSWGVAIHKGGLRHAIHAPGDMTEREAINQCLPILVQFAQMSEEGVDIPDGWRVTSRLMSNGDSWGVQIFKGSVCETMFVPSSMTEREAIDRCLPILVVKARNLMTKPRRKWGQPYFDYDNPEYSGCIFNKGEQAAGWMMQAYSDGTSERLERIEGLCDPDFRVPRIPAGRYKDAPPAVFTGTCPKPDWYGKQGNV